MASKFEQTHDDCRKRVCLLCYRKGDRPILELELQCIKDNLLDGYSLDDLEFPCRLCTACHIDLSKKINDCEFNLVPKVDDYDPGRVTYARSAASSVCMCRICTIAKMTGLEYSRMTRGKRGRPSKTAQQTIVKFCSNCYQKIYQGSNHSVSNCKSRKRKITNASNLVSSPTTRQRLASNVLKEHEGTPLATLGPPRKTDVTEPLPAGKPFTSKQLFGMQTDLGLSNTRTRVLAQNLRLASGSRKAVEKGFKKSLTEHSHSLDDFSKVVTISYVKKDKETKIIENYEQSTVVCTDIPKFIDQIIEKRSLQDCDSLLIKVGIDGGGGFLKFCLGVFDMDNLVSGLQTGLAKKFKDSGVKKVFLVATAPGVSEDYVNVKKIWLNLGLHKMNRKYTFATDLKLCNVLLGLMTHSSCHPCCWCEIERGNLVNKGKSRTIASLNKLFWDFFEAKTDKSEAKHYGNVIHPPIISDNLDDSTLVIEVFPPPELHLLIGPVNTLYDGLEKVWPRSEEWLNICNVKKTDYHGGKFEGNDSRKLLKKVDQLEGLAPNNKVVKKYAKAFKALNDVVHACYGYDLADDYLVKISSFSVAYLNLKINVTPKIHAVMHHISEFCKKTRRGLGPWSEQASESIHHDFKQTWQRFKINSTDHELYAENLLKAVQHTIANMFELFP